LTQNNLWQYSGSQSLTGQPPPTTTYANTRTITGTKVIGSTTTVVSGETNSFNAGAASQEYLVKNTTGLTIWGNNDVTDQITPQLVPYQALRFPLQPGSTFQPFNKQGLDFGQDLDGDGKNETASTSSQVKIMEAETITVPAGTFPNTIRVETT